MANCATEFREVEIVTEIVRAFILSVDGTCRNKLLIPNLMELGIDYQIISGAGPDEAMQYVIGKSVVRNVMTPSQMACTLGHRLMHQAALSSSAEWFIFLEDDATIEPAFSMPVFKDLTQLGNKVILLGSCGGIVHKTPIAQFGLYEVFLFACNGATGSHAYLANREVTSGMFESSWGLPRLADSFSRSNSTDLCVVLPFLSFQASGGQTYIPLKSSQGNNQIHRKILSSLKADFFDWYHFRLFGARTLRLAELEKIVSKFFKILPGCDVDSPR